MTSGSISDRRKRAGVVFKTMLFILWMVVVALGGATAGAQSASTSASELSVARRRAIAAQGQTPDELGRIPILEYHAIGGEAEFANGPLYDIHGLNIAPETFRKQLEAMYAAGWYPVNMRDVLSAHLQIPRGCIPVVLTFDDARPTQFRYLKGGKIDPNCAVGILEAFHAAHPDWPRRATFYVLPESQWNGVPFDQDGLETRKLRYLVRCGYEIGNHTTSHRSLETMDQRTLRWEMANAVRYLRARLPHLKIDTMALPYGLAPKNHVLWNDLLDGSQGSTHYANRCILLANGGPSFAFADRHFDRTQVMRIVPAPGLIERWITDLKPGAAVDAFVSDGDPNTVTIPQSREIDLNRQRLRGARLVVMPDSPESKGN